MLLFTLNSACSVILNKIIFSLVSKTYVYQVTNARDTVANITPIYYDG